MSLLSLKHVFGIESSLSHSVFYLDDDNYVYPSSRHVIYENRHYKNQCLINCENQFDKFECLAISPNKEYLAVALNTLDKCRIIIYYLNKNLIKSIGEKKVVLSNEKIRSKHLLSIAFSTNSKSLAAIYGEPDYILVCWSIDQLKPIGIISICNNLSNKPTNIQVSFNPIDSCEILITGNNIYERYRLNNGRFSLHDQQLSEEYRTMNITCHCWINQYYILLGSDTAFIYRIDQYGHILEQYNLNEVDRTTNLSLNQSQFKSLSNIKIKNKKNRSKSNTNSEVSSQLIFDETIRSQSYIQQNDSLDGNTSFQSLEKSLQKKQINNSTSITCLLVSLDQVFASIRGYVIIYEINPNDFQLTYLRKLLLPSSKLKELTFDQIDNHSNEIIKSLSLSKNSEKILVGTNENHLYELDFSNLNSPKNQSNLFENLLYNVHQGSIREGEFSRSKSLLFTLGMDRTIKIWNLETKNQQLDHQFVDEPLSITIHPNGIFICIAFANVVRIYFYTIDGLNLFKQFQISNAQTIKYSNQGHVLVIGYENIIQVQYHSDYDQLIYRRTIKKKFRLIRWSHDDAFFLSVDDENVIIQWNPYTGQQLSQYQIFDFNVEDLILSNDNKLAYILTNHKKIKELFLMASIRDIHIHMDNCIPTALCLNDQTKDLFVGSENGSIYSIKLTQTNSIDDTNTHSHFLQKHVHQGYINQIIISSKNGLLISMGEDGKIILYYLNSFEENDSSTIKSDDQILVKQSLLKDQNIQLNKLEKEELNLRNKYENLVQIKETEYNEHLDQLDISSQSNISLINNKLEELREKLFNLKNENKFKLNKLINEKDQSINEFIQQKTVYFQNRINHNQLNKSNIQHFKKTNFDENNLQSIFLSFQQKIIFIKNKFLQDRRDLNESINSLEEMKSLIDEDYFIELTHANENYQNKLRKILNNIEQIENEEILLKTRIKQIEEESMDYDQNLKQIESKRKEFIENLEDINKNFNLNQKLIEQRNFIIQEKIKQTNEIENRKDQYEKFSYVFNYKINELNDQIDPRISEIVALKQLFNKMSDEYHLLIENNQKHSIQINDYQSKLKNIQKELYHQKSSIRILNELTIEMNQDLKNSSDLINQPAQLIKFIKNLYSKYIINRNTNKNFDKTNLFDSDRQRTFYERTNKRFQKKILTDFQKEKNQQIRRIKEQINLMKQISSYSLKIVQLQRTLSHLDILFNISKMKNLTTSTKLVQQLQIELNSQFLEEKQNEFNSILNKQEKRIQQLLDFLFQIDNYLQQPTDPCLIQLSVQFKAKLSNSIDAQI